MTSYQPLAGGKILRAVRDQNCIIMAANVRIATGVAKGLLEAARETDSAIMLELAKSECDLSGGYTGFTPQLFAERMQRAADSAGWDVWALHADHLTVKKGAPEEIADIKALISAQAQAGYTSYAIDASFLFDTAGRDTAAQLARNVEVTRELAAYIKEVSKIDDLGLEVEVGEIGKKNDAGMVVTTPEEATTYISKLKQVGVAPQVLAIANGSTHGYMYDQTGNRIEQVSIDIPQTRAIAQALRDMGSDVRIAQHGITGTPRHLIATEFPRGDIIKGNVGTFWQTLVWDVLATREQDLYKQIWDWTLSTYASKVDPSRQSNPQHIFDKYSKFAIKQFLSQLNSLPASTEQAIRQKARKEATLFIDAFGSRGSAVLVRKA